MEHGVVEAQLPAPGRHRPGRHELLGTSAPRPPSRSIRTCTGPSPPTRSSGAAGLRAHFRAGVREEELAHLRWVDHVALSTDCEPRPVDEDGAEEHAKQADVQHADRNGALVRAMTPVAFPRAADAPVSNKWCFLLVPMPCEQPTPAARLEAAHRTFAALKAGPEAPVAKFITDQNCNSPGFIFGKMGQQLMQRYFPYQILLEHFF